MSPSATDLRTLDALIDAVATDHLPPSGKQAQLLSLLNSAAGSDPTGTTVRFAAVDDAFDPSLDGRLRRSVALVLVHLLSRSDELWNSNTTFRHSSINLFDATLPDVYKAAGIDDKDQSHEKLGMLAALPPRATEELSRSVQGLTSLTAVDQAEQQFLRAIANPLVRGLLLPFLPETLTAKTTLVALFRAVDAYQSAEIDMVIATFEYANDLAKEYRETAEEWADLHGIEPFLTLARQLEALLAASFAANPANAPAAIDLRLTGKKYPLHREAESLEVALEVVNRGPGAAIGLSLTVDAADGLEVDEESIHLGHLRPGARVVVLRCKTATPVSSSSGELLVHAEWQDLLGVARRSEAHLRLEGQRTDLDWETLENASFYELEPITDHSKLVGRDGILSRLSSNSTSKAVGSSYIYGQKRVGKTSLVRSLKDLIEQTSDDIHVVYLEGGDYVHVEATNTVAALGRLLCEELQYSDSRLANLDIPAFTDALAPFANFHRAATRQVPSLRTLFILDEFDALPLGLYRRSPEGDAFFLTLRTMSGKPGTGFILVGGENMELILSSQGENLNKFQQYKVDYFTRSDQWDDYFSLVRRPVEEWLEITDEAVIALHDLTGGNPYFSNLVCGELSHLMIERRDCYATNREVAESADLTLSHIGASSFMHFWEDGLFATGSEAEAASLERRQVLLSFAHAMRDSQPTSLEGIARYGKIYGLDEVIVESHLSEFVRRGILSDSAGIYECVIPLFQRWLYEHGFFEIITQFADREGIEALRSAEAAAFVTSGEIVALTSRWPLFQGRAVDGERVRAWLDQFPNSRSQRLMFTLLENLRFFSDVEVRELLREAQVLIDRSQDVSINRERYGRGKERRRDVLIVRTGGPTKSGAVYTKLYVEENAIHMDDVVDIENLERAFAKSDGYREMVMVDDFLGSGDSLARAIEELDAGARELGVNLPIHVVALVGFEQGVARVERQVAGLDRDVMVRVCRPLSAADQAFSQAAQMFEASELSEARTIAREMGAQLVSQNPLGWHDGQALVVFAQSIPNNSLPILWASGKTRAWTPLFPRF